MVVRRSRISAGKGQLTLSRTRSEEKHLVYVLLANRPFKYSYGRSKVAYIGTTERGLKRITESVAKHADAILNNHGVTTLSTRFYTCRGRRRVQMWRKLERALIISFRERYGEIPQYNVHGRGWRWDGEDAYFGQKAVRKVIDEMG